MRAFTAVILSLACALTLTGCSTGGAVATENDRLRAQVLDLEKQVKTLKGRSAELETQLARATSAPSSVPADIIANTPHVTAIGLSRLSQARDENGDGRLDTIILYLEPTDGLGRFLQIVGRVAMHAAILPSDGPAKTIGQKTLGPAEVRDGYRSAFTGQYYALALPIDPPETPKTVIPAATAAGEISAAASVLPPESPATQCTVRVEFTDGYTGQKFSTERVIDLR